MTMKKQLVKLILLVACIGGIAMSADAQRRGRTRGQTTPANNQQSPDTTSQQVNNVNRASGYNPYGNTPIEMAPRTGGFTDSTKPSLRNDAAYEKSGMKDRTPLQYDHLRGDDALFTERVWREIDTREKINQVFNYKADDDNGDQRFVQILVKAVRDKKATAFSADDDRFTTPLDSAAFEKLLTGGAACDTLPVYKISDPTQIEKYVVDCSSLNPDDIVKFRVKEDWVFDRESSRLVCRILGIAPLKTILGVDKKTERGATPMFWIYYPDLRPTLAKYEVYNPKNMGQSRMTWEELFESRMFSSYIVKSTMDNPQNKFIRNYIKDPILALLEGDNIKDKIFNYEQDLWSY
jgi:gliding motility associated protien GldN